MNKKIVQRRVFLKSISGFLLGAILLPFERFLRNEKSDEQKSSSMKEAMHYSTDDNLAG